MAITPYNPSLLGTFTKAPAGNNEKSRIVSIAIFKVGTDVSALDGTATTWDPKITAGDIIPILPVTGSFSEPSENTRPGIGYVDTETTSLSYDQSFFHYGVDDNLAFYNSLNQDPNGYAVGFVFEDLKMYVPLDRNGQLIPANILARPVTEEELGGIRQMRVNVRWKHIDLPYVIDCPESIFGKSAHAA